MSDKKPDLKFRNMNFSAQLVVYTSELSTETSPIPRTPYIDVPSSISYIYHIPTHSRRFTHMPHAYIRYPISHTDWRDSSTSYSISMHDIQFCMQNTISEEELTETVHRWEKATKTQEPVMLDLAQALARDLLSDEKISMLYQYWIQRREEVKHPLVRKYWQNEGFRDQYLSRIFKLRRLEKRKLRERYSNEEILQSSKRVIRQLEDLLGILKLVLHRENIKKNILSYNLAEFEIKRTKHNSEVCKAFYEILSKLENVNFSGIKVRDLSVLPYLKSSKHVYKSYSLKNASAPTCHTRSIPALKKPIILPIQVRKTRNNNLIFYEESLPKLPVRETYKLVKVVHKTILLNQ